MAFSPKKISPLDLRPSIGVGVSLLFSSATAFRTTYTTKEAIKSNLINFFLTNPGERIGNPEFGGGLRNFIFSQINQDSTEFLKEDIQTKISKITDLKKNTETTYTYISVAKCTCNFSFSFFNAD